MKKTRNMEKNAPAPDGLLTYFPELTKLTQSPKMAKMT